MSAIPVYTCFACDATIDHPMSEDDCGTVHGVCAHLFNAGWRLVDLHPMVETEPGKFAMSWFVCPLHAKDPNIGKKPKK